MSILQVYSLPNLMYYQHDFVLHRKCREVTLEEIHSPWFQSLVSDMFETLYADPSGVGLAAPQIGISLRLVVIDIRRDAKKPLVLVNPTYEAIGSDKVESNETCLSVPLRAGKVIRHKSVLVHAQDYYGTPIEIRGEKFLSNVLQHEIDHLDGILYIDRMGNLDELITHNGYANSMAQRAIEITSQKEVNH